MAMMDLIELEAWLHLKQEITCRLMVKSVHWGCSPLARVALDTVIAQLARLAPIQSQCFQTVVVHCTLNVHISQQ